MRRNPSLQIGVVLVLAGLVAGCDKLGVGNKPPVADGAPSEQELQKIAYMSSSNSGPEHRKLYDHPEEAKNCGDFELATRWNRPPNIEGGVFHKKMVYLTSGIPAGLPKDSEVFIAGTLEKGDNMQSGAIEWYLRMKDGTVVQAIEMPNFLEKQEQAAQDSKLKALVKPNKAGRAFCGQGVYQGVAGRDPDGQEKKVPLVSVLFGMDRDQ